MPAAVRATRSNSRSDVMPASRAADRCGDERSRYTVDLSPRRSTLYNLTRRRVRCESFRRRRWSWCVRGEDPIYLEVFMNGW